jgi:hypothetical protein
MAWLSYQSTLMILEISAAAASCCCARRKIMRYALELCSLNTSELEVPRLEAFIGRVNDKTVRLYQSAVPVILSFIYSRTVLSFTEVWSAGGE